MGRQFRGRPSLLEACRSTVWLASLLLLALVLAGCAKGFFDLGPKQQPAPVPQLPTATGVRVGLILPLSGPGETQRIGVAMKQAAEMALFDAQNPGIVLLTKDTAGTAQGAEAAARAALEEGAEIILGPLLANEVQAVTPIARARNVPVIAFSSVSATAGGGTYLLSFLPEEEVSNVVRYAGETGIRSMTALLPKSQYGAAVERALAQSARAGGINIVGIQRFARTNEGMSEPARQIAAAVNSPGAPVQAVLVAEGGDLLRQLGFALQQAGFSPNQAKVLGTGLWDDPVTRAVPVAVGGWYAGVAPELVSRFQNRYAKSYGASPPRLASLAYDAVSLTIILARGESGARFSAAAITNPDGFQGINGLFRFRPNGLNERGLSILEVTSGGVRAVAPAPQRFTAGY